MSNSSINEVLQYHESTKHSEVSVRGSHFYLDWANKPRAFKVFPKISPRPLPINFPHPGLGALTSVSRLGPQERIANLSAGTVAELLFFTGGLTREVRFPDGAYYMRAAPATGALYPIELYVICGEIEGLEAGVYHFGPGDFSLTPLRGGDYRAVLSRATARNQEIASSPVTIAMTALAWRNAWKYQARSYRHWFWDSGAMAANLLATAVSAGLTAKLVMGFDDAGINLLLGLEARKEASVVLVPIGAGLVEPSKEQTRPIAKLSLEAVPSSAKEVNFPEILRAHGSSSLEGTEVADWVEAGFAYQGRIGRSEGQQFPLLLFGSEMQEDSLEKVILRRGSTRRFARRVISYRALSTILYSSSRGVPFDFLRPGETLIETYLIANSVDGLPPGAYFYDRDVGTLAQLKEGSFRKSSGYLCLEQQLFSDASVVLFLMADLQTILKHLGNRGYRTAQFEAGVVLGKVYLSAYAQRLGASGSTFYDDAVTDFFSPHAANMNAMVAVGVGIPDYVPREGKILVGKLNKAQLMK